MVGIEAFGRLAHTASQLPAGSLLGLVGIGHMGGAMALNLLKHKHRVLVYDKNPAAADKLCKHRATRVSSPADMVTTPGKLAAGQYPCRAKDHETGYTPQFKEFKNRAARSFSPLVPTYISPPQLPHTSHHDVRYAARGPAIDLPCVPRWAQACPIPH